MRRIPQSLCLIGLALAAAGFAFKLNHYAGAHTLFNLGAAVLVACCFGRSNCCGARPVRRMDEPLDFSAEIERFEMKGAWSWRCPRPSGRGRRIQATIGSAPSMTRWHCAILPIGDGRRFVVTSKDKLKAVGADLGHHVHVALVPDLSKYGMALPEDLAEMLGGRS